MFRTLSLCLALIFCVSSTALAHFGMVIPSSDIVMEKKDADLSLALSFSHPMEMVGMPFPLRPRSRSSPTAKPRS